MEELKVLARTPRAVKVELSTDQPEAEVRPMPWLLATIGGAAAVAVAAWVLLAGAAVIGWLAAPTDSFSDALVFGTDMFILANGGSVTMSTAVVSLVPLGLTAIIVLLASGAAGFAAQQAEQAGVLDKTVAWRIIGAFTGVYAACVLLAVIVTSQFGGIGRALLGSVLIAGGSSVLVVLRTAGIDLRASWPVWARSIPKAAGAALLIVLIGAGIALSAALLLAKDRVVELHDSLGAGIAGGLLLLVIQLAYVPNFLSWCASWVLGAGFSVGADSVISPTSVEVGLLPALPVFGAVPPPGVGSASLLWWLATGVLAGAAAAWIVVRARPKARWDETALVGGLSGVAAGLLVVGVCALSNGSFGADRMMIMGARLVELLVLAPTLLGISGLVLGLVLGIVLRNRAPGEPVDEENTIVDEPDDADEDTEAVGGADADEVTGVVERHVEDEMTATVDPDATQPLSASSASDEDTTPVRDS